MKVLFNDYLLGLSISFLNSFFFLLMNNLTQLMREYSKRKPATFSDISFPISEEIQNKIRNKNHVLKSKMQKRIEQKSKIHLKGALPQCRPLLAKGISGEMKHQAEEVNYLQAFIQQQTIGHAHHCDLNISAETYEVRDEQIAIKIYYLIAKRKKIFKVEQVQRKLQKSVLPNQKRNQQKHCRGDHKYQHIFGQNDCVRSHKKKLKNQKNANSSAKINEQVNRIIQQDFSFEENKQNSQVSKPREESQEKASQRQPQLLEKQQQIHSSNIQNQKSLEELGISSSSSQNDSPQKPASLSKFQY